jgi:signal transduction histidine kinase
MELYELRIENNQIIQIKMKKPIFLLIFFVFLPCFAFAQYWDHRNRHVDSLENILATNPPEGKELRLIYDNLMMGYLQINGQKSMEYARKCIAAYIPVDGWKGAAGAYNVLAINFWGQSQYDSAMVYYEKALDAAGRMRNFPEKYKELDIDDRFSMIYGNMGNLFNIQGKYHEAIDYYLKALKIFEQYGWKESQAHAYRNIGEMYIFMDNYEQSEINFRKLDELAHEVNDSLFIATAKMEMSKIYMYHKEYDKALQNAEIANSYNFSHPDEEGDAKAETLNLLSKIYLEGYDDDRRAEKYARESLQAYGNLREKSISLRLISAIYLKRGQWRQAEQTALEALQTDDSEPANTLVLYEILTKAYSKEGNSDKAWEYFDKHNSLQSSWSNRNYQSVIREMETKYETEKKELEIERQQSIISSQNIQRRLLVASVAVCIVFLTLLWYMLRLRSRRNLALSERNSALTERNDALADMNATKDKYFSIISHDLRNPAVTQRDALQLLLQNARLWDADRLTAYYRELLKSAEGQVELIYNLLGWAQIQTGRMTYTPETFVFSDLLSDLTLIRKMAENKSVAFDVHIPNRALVTGDSNMLSVVLRNLLTNAVKFTPAGGQISLAVEAASDGKYTVTVSDNGIGISREQMSHLFRLDNPHSRKGTVGEQGSGLGLIVCKELLEKHGTTLHVESEEGKGSRFWFEV